MSIEKPAEVLSFEFAYGEQVLNWMSKGTTTIGQVKSVPTCRIHEIRLTALGPRLRGDDKKKGEYLSKIKKGLNLMREMGNL